MARIGSRLVLQSRKYRKKLFIVPGCGTRGSLLFTQSLGHEKSVSTVS